MLYVVSICISQYILIVMYLHLRLRSYVKIISRNVISVCHLRRESTILPQQRQNINILKAH